MATIDDDGGDDGGTSGDGGIRNSQRMHFIGARRMPSKRSTSTGRVGIAIGSRPRWLVA